MNAIRAAKAFTGRAMVLKMEGGYHGSHDAVEPVMGAAGVIPASREYIAFLGDATAHCGALLIFDEVVTMRLNYWGARTMYGMRPDLTALGKIIGDGFPIGAFGGRKDVMAQLDPRARKLRQSGTFIGNAISMAATMTWRRWNC